MTASTAHRYPHYPPLPRAPVPALYLMQVAIARMAATAALGFVVAVAAASVQIGAGTGEPPTTTTKTTTTTGAATTTTITASAITGGAAATVTTTVASDFAVTTVKIGKAPHSGCCAGEGDSGGATCCEDTPAVDVDCCSSGGCSDSAQAPRSTSFVANVVTGLLEAFEEVAVWVGLGIVVTAAVNAIEPHWAEGLSNGVLGRLGLVVGSMPFQMCEYGASAVCLTPPPPPTHTRTHINAHMHTPTPTPTKVSLLGRVILTVTLPPPILAAGTPWSTWWWGSQSTASRSAQRLPCS